MKRLAITTLLMLTLTACGQTTSEQTPIEPEQKSVVVQLSDKEILVDGEAAGTEKDAVYVANDIVYYESGKDFTYGEGSEDDAHSADEAAAHTVVHITEPGTYSISGKLSKGQIAVDLGEDAKEDTEAVVTLVMNGADITCDVAPAVIFYNVYECGNTDEASKDVDTSSAGANIIIADGTTNTVNGSYVARIYEPDSVVLNEDKTEVEDADKLHKYDAAFYSRMSMNVNGDEKGDGVLNINAENEGLDSELHLTINGGYININSGNDGINTNEDGVSVTTINGGNLTINVTGETGEGDGIDSNGWLVINGGSVTAAACSNSADAGIDSDMGIYINGGTVIASGHMLDQIEQGGQTHVVFNFAETQDGSETLCLKDEEDKAVMEICPGNAYSVLVYSSPELKAGTYTLWSNDKQMAGQGGGMAGGFGMGGARPEGEGMTPPDGEMPEGIELPEGMEPPEGMKRPEGMEPPEGMERPEGMEPPEGMDVSEVTTEFKINDGTNMFGQIKLI